MSENTEKKNEECELIELDDAQYKTFSKEFLKHYLYDGYGTMPKKEIDILVFHLISESGDIKGKTNYEVANKLSLTESKVKGLILESSLKYNPADHEAVVGKIINRLLEKDNNINFNNNSISVSLENPVDKREFEFAIKSLGTNSYVEYSFNKEILKVNVELMFNIMLKHAESKNIKLIKAMQAIEEWKNIKNIDDFKGKFQDLMNKGGKENIIGFLRLSWKAICKVKNALS